MFQTQKHWWQNRLSEYETGVSSWSAWHKQRGKYFFSHCAVQDALCGNSFWGENSQMCGADIHMA